MSRAFREVEGNGSPLLGAHAENRHGKLPARPVGDVAPIRNLVGDEQRAPLLVVCAFQQIARKGEGAFHVAAQLRHHAGGERGQEVRDRLGIVREGRYRVRIARVDDERREAFSAHREHVGDLVPRTHETRWREILGVHRKREIEHHHQRVAALLDGLR
jgi:hypothetical protein